MHAEYGTAELQIDTSDGTVTVLHADDLIGVTDDLLTQIGFKPDGVLTLDTAGEYRYLSVGPSRDPGVTLFNRII
jgi:hypothetical protein